MAFSLAAPAEGKEATGPPFQSWGAAGAQSKRDSLAFSSTEANQARTNNSAASATVIVACHGPFLFSEGMTPFDMT